MASREHISQIVLSAQPATTSTVYIDNLFFSREAAASTPKLSLNTFNVYPNPAKGTVNVQLNANELIQSIELINVQGQTLLSKAVNASVSNETLNVSNLVSGIYFVQVTSENGSATSRIVVNN